MKHTAEGVCFVAPTLTGGTTMRVARHHVGAAASPQFMPNYSVMCAGTTGEVAVVLPQ